MIVEHLLVVLCACVNLMVLPSNANHALILNLISCNVIWVEAVDTDLMA